MTDSDTSAQPPSLASLAARLQGQLGADTFPELLRACANSPDFIAGYDRVHGTTLAGRAIPLVLAIEEASGKRDSEVNGFVGVCWDVFLRITNTPR